MALPSRKAGGREFRGRRNRKTATFTATEHPVRKLCQRRRAGAGQVSWLAGRRALSPSRPRPVDSDGRSPPTVAGAAAVGVPRISVDPFAFPFHPRMLGILSGNHAQPL